jgi:transcriptional regulator with XRE-family HTH domain
MYYFGGESAVVTVDAKKTIKSIQSRLQTLMYDNKLTFEKLAEEADISVDTVKKIFRKGNVSIPTYETLMRLAKSLGVSPDYLTDFINEEKQDAIVYFRQLLIAAKKLGFTIESKESSVCIKCDDPKLMKFYNAACDIDNYELDKYARLIIFHGEVISEADFYEIKKKCYLYGELVELEGDEALIEEYIEAVDDVVRYTEEVPDIEEKLEEWDKTAGHPHKFISDFYFATFYKDYEPIKQDAVSGK